MPTRPAIHSAATAEVALKKRKIAPGNGSQEANRGSQEIPLKGSLKFLTVKGLWKKELAGFVMKGKCFSLKPSNVTTNDLSPVVIYIATGDKFFTYNGVIHITLFDSKNKELSEKLFIGNKDNPDFKPGEIYKFTVPKSKLKNPDSPPLEVSKIQIFNDNEESYWHQWYMDKVVVENTESDTVSVFPWDGWIEGQKVYTLDREHTKVPEADEDRKELEKARIDYQYHETNGNASLPAQVAKLPSEETFPFFKKVILFGNLEVDIFVSTMKGAWKKNWESLDDLLTVYDDGDVVKFPLPSVVKFWMDDGYFGYQRINGLNHSLIKLCEELPTSLPVTDDMVKKYLNGMTLKTAMEQRRLFVVDLEILQGIHVQDKLTLCAPIGLFFSNTDDELIPVAIRLQRDSDAPVFLPEQNSMKWQLVKMWFNNADAIYHQSVAHLGMTHLLMEGVAVATHRQLATRHPVYKLLKPHFLYLMAINNLARTKLLGPRGYIDNILTTGSKGTLELIGRVLTTWRLDENGTLPASLKRRGLEDPDVLPSYHYREDALALYHAIRKYVTEFVNLYYDQPEKLAGDQEIQAWAADLVRDRDNDEGGCGLQGVPGNGQLQTVDQLVTILTSVIFTCSVEHAAVNFPQYEEYGYPANYPPVLHGTPPGKDNREYGEKDILDALPTPKETLETMVITDVLSQHDGKSLGHFEKTCEESQIPCIQLFQSDLHEITKDIEEKNKKRRRPYTYLDPTKIPNSIRI